MDFGSPGLGRVASLRPSPLFAGAVVRWLEDQPSVSISSTVKHVRSVHGGRNHRECVAEYYDDLLAKCVSESVGTGCAVAKAGAIARDSKSAVAEEVASRCGG